MPFCHCETKPNTKPNLIHHLPLYFPTGISTHGLPIAAIFTPHTAVRTWPAHGRNDCYFIRHKSTEHQPMGSTQCIAGTHIRFLHCAATAQLSRAWCQLQPHPGCCVCGRQCSSTKCDLFHPSWVWRTLWCGPFQLWAPPCSGWQCSWRQESCADGWPWCIWGWTSLRCHPIWIRPPCVERMCWTGCHKHSRHRTHGCPSTTTVVSDNRSTRSTGLLLLSSCPAATAWARPRYHLFSKVDLLG